MIYIEFVNFMELGVLILRFLFGYKVYFVMKFEFKDMLYNILDFFYDLEVLSL